MTTKTNEEIVNELEYLLSDKKWGSTEKNFLYNLLTQKDKEIALAVEKERERIVSKIDELLSYPLIHNEMAQALGVIKAQFVSDTLEHNESNESNIETF